MNALFRLFNEYILIDVVAEKEQTTTTYSMVKYPRGSNSDIDIKNKRNSIAIIYVSGDKIISKSYPKASPEIKRITENNDLIWEKQKEGIGEITISFLRKDILSKIIDDLEECNIVLLGICMENLESSDKNLLIEKTINQSLSMNSLKNITFSNSIFNVLFNKFKLLVLLFYFILLLGNFFYSEKIRNELQLNQVSYNILVLNTKKKNENQDKISRITKNINYQNYRHSLISDRIASYIPKNITLELLSINPPNENLANHKDLKINQNIILIKGWTDISGAVVSLSQNLSSDNLFVETKINSISQRKNSELFDFEIQITL